MGEACRVLLKESRPTIHHPRPLQDFPMTLKLSHASSRRRDKHVHIQLRENQNVVIMHGHRNDLQVDESAAI